MEECKGQLCFNAIEWTQNLVRTSLRVIELPFFVAVKPWGCSVEVALRQLGNLLVVSVVDDIQEKERAH